MKNTLLTLALVLATAPAFAGQNISASVYDSRAALSAESAELATVVAIRPVVIKNSGANTGTYVGGAIGGATGYALTSRTHSFAAKTVGSLLGGVTGAAIGQGAMNARGPSTAVQIFVQRTGYNGRPFPQLTGVVEADDQGIRPGDRVLLVRGRNGFSIVRTDAPAMGPETYARSPAADGTLP